MAKGKWVEFKYLNFAGKPMAHTVNVVTRGQFKQIMQRYELDPLFLFDIRMDGKEISPEDFEKYVNRGRVAK